MIVVWGSPEAILVAVGMAFMFFFISFAPHLGVGTAQTAVAIPGPLEHPVRALVRITSIGNTAFDTYHPGSPDQEQHRILLDVIFHDRTKIIVPFAVNDELPVGHIPLNCPDSQLVPDHLHHYVENGVGIHLEGEGCAIQGPVCACMANAREICMCSRRSKTCNRL